MNLRLRFKKALFAFFKEEILEAVGHNPKVQIVEHVSGGMRVRELKSEILIEGYPTMDIKPVYEKALDKAKQELFNSVMDFIKIDHHSVIDSHTYPHRAIRLSLFVGDSK